MTVVNLTEFRSNASCMLSRVERGEKIVVLRHGKPIAQVSPVSMEQGLVASWKRPALRLVTKGGGLASMILRERNDEDIS